MVSFIGVAIVRVPLLINRTPTKILGFYSSETEMQTGRFDAI